MKRFLSLSFLLLSSSFALANNYDICNRITGLWSGIFNLKNQETCSQYGGCIHIIRARVEHISDHTYRAYIQPAIGKSGAVTLICENGKISSSMPNSTISLNCDKAGMCFVNYADPNTTCEMANQ